MLARGRRRFAMLQFIVSRADARGFDAMLCDADARRVSRGGSCQNAGHAKLCCDDRRTDSSRVGIDPLARKCGVGRT